MRIGNFIVIRFPYLERARERSAIKALSRAINLTERGNPHLARLYAAHREMCHEYEQTYGTDPHGSNPATRRIRENAKSLMDRISNARDRMNRPLFPPPAFTRQEEPGFGPVNVRGERII